MKGLTIRVIKKIGYQLIKSNDGIDNAETSQKKISVKEVLIILLEPLRYTG